MKYKRMTWLASVLAFLLILSGCNGAAEAEMPAESNGPEERIPVSAGLDEVLEKDGEWLAGYEPFLRLDNDAADAWQQELENFRIITQGQYALGEAKEKYNLDKSYPVNTVGLDTLNASASGQFSEPQFRELADTLREVADGKEIVIVDLREESHYLLNGISISLFRLHNFGNLGVDPETIEAAEAEYFDALLGETVTAYVEDDEEKQDEQLTFTVESAVSEAELVESEGFTYLRLPCTDHAWPDPWEIDAFMDYVKSVDLDNTWFHFHCHAGSGRTGAFMMLLDKMKNPDVSEKDIFYRQAMMGSNYPLYLGDADSYKRPLYEGKAVLAPLLMQYLQENHRDNYALSWSDWLAEQ